MRTQQMVETVKAMFPHIPEPSIRYDLLRSGSAEATCERILQDGYLPMVCGRLSHKPPPHFPGVVEMQRAANAPPATTTTTPPRAQSTASAASTGTTPDLIKRFHLDERVASADAAPSAAEPVKCQWEAQPQDREKALQERKAQMILQARKYVSPVLTQAHAATQN